MREDLNFRALLKLYSEKINVKNYEGWLWSSVLSVVQGSGILKCPAESNQKNGLEIYHKFL